MPLATNHCLQAHPTPDMTVLEVRSGSNSDSEPLLSQEHRRHAPPQPNPLPKLQLAVVFFIKLVIPIAGTQTLPYINVLVADLAKASGAQTGYYSGLVVGSSLRLMSCNLTALPGKRQVDCAFAHHILLGIPIW